MKAAMIFAAGFGTRMGALTKSTPKPMVPLLGRPMIDHTIDLLRDAGVERLVANTHYLPERITPHLHRRGVMTSHEDTILETGGGLRAAELLIGTSPVITMNPDAAWAGRNPVSQLCDAWREDMQALLMLVPSPEGSESDDFSLEKGQISRIGPYRYTGLQLVRTDRLAEISTNVFSLNRYWDLLAETAPIHGVVYQGRWQDIGTPEGLAHAEGMLRS